MGGSLGRVVGYRDGHRLEHPSRESKPLDASRILRANQRVGDAFFRPEFATQLSHSTPGTPGPLPVPLEELNSAPEDGHTPRTGGKRSVTFDNVQNREA